MKKRKIKRKKKVDVGAVLLKEVERDVETLLWKVRGAIKYGKKRKSS